MDQFEFTEVVDVRFPDRKILIGKHSSGLVLYASFKSETGRQRAEHFIRQKVTPTEPFMGDEDGWG